MMRRRRRRRRRSTRRKPFRFGLELAGCCFIGALAAHLIIGDPCAANDPVNILRYLAAPESAVISCVSSMRDNQGAAPAVALQAINASDIERLKKNAHLIPSNVQALCDADCRRRIEAQLR